MNRSPSPFDALRKTGPLTPEEAQALHRFIDEHPAPLLLQHEVRRGTFAPTMRPEQVDTIVAAVQLGIEAFEFISCHLPDGPATSSRLAGSMRRHLARGKTARAIDDVQKAVQLAAGFTPPTALAFRHGCLGLQRRGWLRTRGGGLTIELTARARLDLLAMPLIDLVG